MNYKDVDRMILENCKTVSIEQHQELMKAFEISKREPSVQLSIAMFRDAMVMQEMTKALVFQMRIEIDDLNKRISRLEADR